VARTERCSRISEVVTAISGRRVLLITRPAPLIARPAPLIASLLSLRGTRILVISRSQQRIDLRAGLRIGRWANIH
jgi:hypothetical protein